MDKETLKAMGIEGDAADKILAAHTATLNAEVTGLKNKNSELLGKLDKKKGLDPAEVERLKQIENEFNSLKTKQEEEQGEFKKLYGTTKTEFENFKGEVSQKLSSKDTEITGLKKQLEINKALGNHKVIPGMHEIAVNTILPNVALDENGKAMVGSKKVSEFVDSWVAGDVGKHFIANSNSGGGADGSGGGQTYAEEMGWFKKGSPTHNVTKQGQLRKQDPALYDRLKAAAEKG